MTVITTFGTTRQSLVTLEYWLKDIFSKYSERKLSVALVRSLDDIKSFAKSQNEKINFGFPFMGLVIASYSLDTSRGGGRPDSTLRLSHNSNGKTTILDRMPIKLGIGARLQSDSLDEILCMCHALAMSFPSVVFTYEYEEFSHNIGIKVDPEYTIPNANLSSPGDSFQLETTFQLSFVEGDMREMPSIKSISINIYDKQTNKLIKEPVSSDFLDSIQLRLK